MIIDKILERKEGAKYNAKEFYNYVSGAIGGGEEIASAMDSGTEYDVKKLLNIYILENDYKVDFIFYINSVNWL